MKRFWFAAAVVALVFSPAQARFFAAAGKADITPDPSRDTVWLAGYGASGRRAEGIQQPLYARGLVVSDGKRTVALVALDSFGLQREDVLSWRRELGWTGGERYLFAAATHSHSAPDTLGLWGRFPGMSGYDAAYRRRVRAAVVGLVRALSGKLEEAEISAGRTDVDPRGLCTDDRAPFVIDPELEAVRVRGAAKHEPIATLVRWSCHPVVFTKANRNISPDFPGPLCDRIESSGGGACVYFSGSLGGHLIPETDRSASVARQLEDVHRIGEAVAQAALKALAKAEPIRGDVRFRSESVRVPIENSRYLAFLPALASGHRLLDASGAALPGWKDYWLPIRHLLRFPLPARLRPWVETEASVVDIGSVRIAGVPAEIFPEEVLGGYDGKLRFGHPLISKDNANPPRLDQAPKGPYLREKLHAKYGIVVSLANDELGYLVPSYDFQAAPSRTMLPQPRGTHYEETESVGRSATGLVLEAFDDLLK